MRAIRELGLRSVIAIIIPHTNVCVKLTDRFISLAACVA